MRENDIILPSRPKIILEEDTKGVYEIDGLYAGYGNTVGNSLRRVILSSLPGAAITTVKIEGINHEFSTIPGMKEDVVMLVLNLKQVRFRLFGDEPQKATIAIKGAKIVCAGDFKCPSQLEVLNRDKVIATLTDKKSELEIELTAEKGIGYVPVEQRQKEKISVGTLVLDAIFSPVVNANFSVENIRVGQRTDYNKLILEIETDKTVAPKEALRKAIQILKEHLVSMEQNLGAEEVSEETEEETPEKTKKEKKKKSKE